MLVVLLLSTTSAFAHFKIGTYKGTTQNGEICSMQVKGVTFNYNLKNPLNEKVEIIFNNETYFIGHVPLFNENTSQVNVNFEKLVANKGTTTGGQHFALNMNHDREEGPKSFIFVDHNWKTNAIAKTECLNLEFAD
jgi:hypothetical protein